MRLLSLGRGDVVNAVLTFTVPGGRGHVMPATEMQHRWQFRVQSGAAQARAGYRQGGALGLPGWAWGRMAHSEAA